MPRIKLTKSAIDALPTPSSDVVYWDAAYPGFGVKITPKGRKVFIVLYRTGGAGSYLRKHHRAIWPRNASSGPRGSAEGVRSEARRTGSGGREARSQAASSGRSGR
jgi:hypothetical protein